MEISWNFVSTKKWETWKKYCYVFVGGSCRVTLVVDFVFASKFWEVAGTYHWYLFECRLSGEETETYLL